jgi:DNA replication protein DnaC
MQDRAAACTICNDSGWIPVEGTLQVRACACQAELKKRQRVAAAGIPRRYLHCSFANFHLRTSTSLSNARARGQEFADCWPAINSGLLLMGGCGTGKTHLAVAVLQEIVKAAKPGHLLFANFQDLIQQIQASFGSDSAPDKSEILRPLLDADLLVLDELGSQKPTSFVQDILYYLINSRYNGEKATIFTTNYLDEPPPREESLEQRIGGRLRSRLYEMCGKPVNLAGVDDYRKSKARQV